MASLPSETRVNGWIANAGSYLGKEGSEGWRRYGQEDRHQMDFAALRYRRWLTTPYFVYVTSLSRYVT